MMTTIIIIIIIIIVLIIIAITLVCGVQGNVTTLEHMLPKYPNVEICWNPPMYPQHTKLR